MTAAGEDAERSVIGERSRRALVLILVAVLMVLTAGGVYLAPSLTGRAVRPATPEVPSTASPPRVGPVSFGDARHGSVTMIDPVPTTFMTFDGGRTWSLAAGGPRAYSWLQFVGSHVVVREVLGSRSIVELSEDDGRTWRVIETPMPASTFANPDLPAFLDGRRGWWLIARVGVGANGGRFSQAVQLWRTGDGGRTWQAESVTGIPDSPLGGRLVPLDDERALLPLASDRGWSLYSTRDGGDTWQRAAAFATADANQTSSYVNLLVAGLRVVAVDSIRLPDGSLLRYFAHSEDGGVTWSRLVTTPALAPAMMEERGRLLILDGRRLWTSDDGGENWMARLVAAPEDRRLLGLVSAADGKLWAVAADLAAPQPSADGASPEATVLLRSDDGGTRWSPVPLPRAALR